jgi:taurine dioxygenase
VTGTKPLQVQTALDITPLHSGLDFGIRIKGVTRAGLDDAAKCAQINALFDESGMIVFEGIEASDDMQIALSRVFGELKPHPVVTPMGDDPGVIEIKSPPNTGGIVEFGGRRLSHWLPWHFDHCYNNELNRAGVLRATEIVDEGGITGFADGIALYTAFPPELRDRIEGKNILYTLNLIYSMCRFGMPDGFAEVQEKPGVRAFLEKAQAMPRALHPAVWTRKTGEKVLHISPWMSEGIEGDETDEGNALLTEICKTLNALATANSYHHKWKPDEMVIWDNWRMLHCVSGHDPSLGRTMQRTTIKGDYGLGRFEGDAKGGKILEMTV